MMYILTEAEYDALVAKQKADRRIGWLTKKQLQKLCTEIADTMPVVWGWGGPDPKPWGCMITVENADRADPDDYPDTEWYCDKCPVHSICEYDEKRHSK